jgi:hypothetical protein
LIYIEWLLGSVSDFAAHIMWASAAVAVVVLHGSQFVEQTVTQHSSVLGASYALQACHTLYTSPHLAINHLMSATRWPQLPGGVAPIEWQIQGSSLQGVGWCTGCYCYHD